MSDYQKSHEQGFTIIELMIVLMITAVLASLAAPSFINTMRDNRVISAANNVSAAMNLARSEAIARGTAVHVCATDNPAAAVPACGTNWNKGLLVYATDTLSATNLVKVGDPLLEVGVTEAGGISNIKFDYRGRLTAAASIVVVPTTCSAGVNKQVTLDINASGKLGSTVGTCS